MNYTNRISKTILSIALILTLTYSCKEEPKNTNTAQPNVTTPAPNNTNSAAATSEAKAYEVEIDPNSKCYQSNGQDVVQLRFTSDGSRIKGVYNNLTQVESKMRTGVVTGFISNNEIKAVFSYRDGTDTKRQGLIIAISDDHITVTHPEEGNRKIKLPLIDCSGFKK